MNSGKRNNKEKYRKTEDNRDFKATKQSCVKDGKKLEDISNERHKRKDTCGSISSKDDLKVQVLTSEHIKEDNSEPSSSRQASAKSVVTDAVSEEDVIDFVFEELTEKNDKSVKKCSRADGIGGELNNDSSNKSSMGQAFAKHKKQIEDEYGSDALVEPDESTNYVHKVDSKVVVPNSDNRSYDKENNETKAKNKTMIEKLTADKLSLDKLDSKLFIARKLEAEGAATCKINAVKLFAKKFISKAFEAENIAFDEIVASDSIISGLVSEQVECKGFTASTIVAEEVVAEVVCIEETSGDGTSERKELQSKFYSEILRESSVQKTIVPSDKYKAFKKDDISTEHVCKGDSDKINQSILRNVPDKGCSNSTHDTFSTLEDGSGLQGDSDSQQTKSNALEDITVEATVYDVIYDNLDDVVKKLAADVHKNKKDRHFIIDEILKFVETTGDVATDFSELVLNFQLACDLALKYLPSDYASNVFQRSFTSLHDISLSLEFYPTIKSQLTADITVKLENLYNMAMELSDISKQKRSEVEVTCLLTICSFERARGSLNTCKEYINKAIECNERKLRGNRSRVFLQGFTHYHLACLNKDLNQHQLWYFNLGQSFEKFYEANNTRIYETALAYLYRTAWIIGAGINHTMDKNVLNREKEPTFSRQLKQKVLEKILARSQLDLEENEIAQNVLAIIWFSDQLSKKNHEERKVQMLREITLTLPNYPKLRENLLMLSNSALKSKKILNDPVTKYKLARFAFKTAITLAPPLRTVRYVADLVDVVLATEMTKYVFKEHTIPFLSDALDILEKLKTEDEAYRTKQLYSITISLCLCHFQVNEMGDCFILADRISQFNLPFDSRKDLVVHRSLMFYVCSFFYYHVEMYQDSLDQLIKQINLLHKNWEEHLQYLIVALQNFTFIDDIIRHKKKTEIPDGFVSLFAIHLDDNAKYMVPV